MRDYATRYLWHLLSFAKKPSDRGLPEGEVREVERRIAGFIPQTIQYSTTVNLPQTRQRARILWARERSGTREEILKALSLEPEPYWAQPWNKLPEHYRDALASYYELRRNKEADFTPTVNPEEFITISSKGDTTFKLGEIVSQQTFESENRRVGKLGLRPAKGWSKSKGVLKSWGNGDRPLKELEEYEPATVEAEPVPEKYRWLIPFIGDEPLPPEANILLPAVEVVEGERKIDVVLKRLAEGVEGIQDSTQFRLFLTTMAKFHDYSYANQILIMLQRPSATRVAGFVTWKDLGRWVKKGESGIAILAPVFPPKPKKEAGEEEEEEEIPLTPVYFRVVHVFDISQTDGKPLPKFEVPVLTGEANEELFGKVLAMASAQGLEVSFESRPYEDPSIKGQYSPPKSIWVRPEESRAQQLKSLLHEVAHYYSEGVFRTPRRDAETIAESAAFAVGAHYGFDSGVRSFPYVALWAQEKKTLAQNLNTIRKVADTMLHALEGTKSEMLVQVSEEPSAEELKFAEELWQTVQEDVKRRDIAGTYLWSVIEHYYPEKREKQIHLLGFMNEVNLKYGRSIPKEKALELARKWGVESMLAKELMEFLPYIKPENIDLLAKTEGDPLRKFCCRFSDACAPPELLEEGRFLDRISWLRHHYKEKHPGLWGKHEKLVPLIHKEDKTWYLGEWWEQEYSTADAIVYKSADGKKRLYVYWNGTKEVKPVEQTESREKMQPAVTTKEAWLQRLGDCYRLAWRFIMDTKEGWLVHGEIYAGTPLRWIQHAWVELPSDIVFEPVADAFYRKETFYEGYKAKELVRYNVEEAAILAARTKNLGPWTEQERKEYLKEKSPAVIPTQPSVPNPREELEFVSDSPEYIPFTIEQIGYREKLDNAFQSRIAQVQGAK